jgi:uncharacterized protein (DUF488 family)
MKFFTVGHGTTEFADVARVLDLHGVATIVDIRSEPWSRRAPDFSRRRLEGLAAASGFGYRWLGDALGGRPSRPTVVGEDEAPDPAREAPPPAFRDALFVLEELAAGGRVVLLCAEASPAWCHRTTLVAPALVDRGHEVVHLLHDGTALPHHPTLGL